MVGVGGGSSGEQWKEVVEGGGHGRAVGGMSGSGVRPEPQGQPLPEVCGVSGQDHPKALLRRRETPV